MAFIFHVVTKDSAREEFLASFDMMKRVPGFQALSIYQDQSNQNKFTCVEFCDSQESHAEHVKAVTDEVREAWLNLLIEIPQAQFYKEVATIKPLG